MHNSGGRSLFSVVADQLDGVERIHILRVSSRYVLLFTFPCYRITQFIDSMILIVHLQPTRFYAPWKSFKLQINCWCISQDRACMRSALRGCNFPLSHIRYNILIGFLCDCAVGCTPTIPHESHARFPPTLEEWRILGKPKVPVRGEASNVETDYKKSHAAYQVRFRDTSILASVHSRCDRR